MADCCQCEQAQKLRLELSPTGSLRARVPGQDQPCENVAISRCFPWSMPDRYISVRDEKGKEIAMFESLDELDADSRHIALRQLEQMVFNPKIHKVTKLKDEFNITSLTAMTDRGEVTFQVRGRDDIRHLSATRALFRDADGNTYELPDVTKLDHASRRHLSQWF